MARSTRRHCALVIAACGVTLALSACSEKGSDSLAGGDPLNPVTRGDNGGAATTAPGDTPDPTPGPGGTPPTPGTTDTPTGNPGGGSGTTATTDGGTATPPSNPIDDRKLDYGEALRTASLKLVGALPVLADIQKIQNAADVTAQKTAYEALLDGLLADTRFATKQVQFWRDTFKTGNTGTPANGAPNFDSAATFAASIVVQDRPFTDLFTATTGTCPTFANGTFTAANCAGNAKVAGVLTDPGLMAQYFANMAFRRVRFVQETFVCSKFPAEFTTPKPLGGGEYTSPWDFASITGGKTAKIDFQDTSAVICANCHTTLNHIAPLFASFDDKGLFQTSIQVKTPSAGTPTSALTDWLPTGQPFAWRNGTVVTDLPSLGQAVAADPDVARSAVNRIWNFVMSRGDIVNDLATIPTEVTDALLKDFTDNGMKVKRALRVAFTSDDFVKF
jgi:hypothetical protein